jgi:hypothetical protein
MPSTLDKEIHMHSSRPLTVLTLAAAVAASPIAFAQDAPEPASRAEIKAETRAAEKAQQLAPAGESAEFRKPSTTRSKKTRAERKADTREARKEGALAPAGEASDIKVERATNSLRSTKTRAERKADTLAAAKAHKLTPAGEGPGAPAK